MGLWDMPARRVITDTELRFNPYHDPQNGRFTTARGGSGGVNIGRSIEKAPKTFIALPEKTKQS